MTDLPKRKLGRTGLEVTILGYGAMELRGEPRGPDITDEDAERLLNGVLDAGINFIDTSIDYGRSEERIGRFIAHRRHEYYLASKCGCVVGGAQGEHVHTAANIRHGIENSLRLLKTDYLDLVQFHRSLTLPEFEAEGALQEVLKLKSEGKVRFIGVSGTLPNLEQQIESLASGRHLESEPVGVRVAPTGGCSACRRRHALCRSASGLQGSLDASTNVSEQSSRCAQ